MSSSTGFILDNALGAVGHTPLIRLDKIAKSEGFRCNLRAYMHLALVPWKNFDHSINLSVAKVEFTSIGGSVKDRIAKRMVEHAEEEGKLIRGKSVVIEPTSGNTGQLSDHTSPASVLINLLQVSDLQWPAL